MRDLGSQQSRIMKALRAAAEPQASDITSSLLGQISGKGNYIDNMRQIQDQRQQATIGAEQGVYDIMKAQAAQENSEAKAVDDAIESIAGGDPKIYTSILQDLHSDPEPVNAMNARTKVMKYAAERGITPLSVQEATAKLSKTKSDLANIGVGGATGELMNRLMKDNPDWTETDALYFIQTGARKGTRLDANGNIVPIPNALKTTEQFKEAEKTGQLNAELKSDLKKKGISANNVIELIGQAREILPKSSSGLIQKGMTGLSKGAGVSTEASRADARLKVIAAGLTSSVPRMEGPQGVADLLLYKQAAADVANSDLPYEDRIAAVDTMEQLQQKYVQPEEVIPEGGNINPEKKRLKYNPATGEFE